MSNKMTKVENAILRLIGKKGGFLFSPDNLNKQNQIYVPVDIIRKNGLCEGATITGLAEYGNKGLYLKEVKSVCEMPPNEFKNRIQMDRLTAINPDDRFDFSNSKYVSMRIIDMFIPIGKGTRAMVVSPPKAGKTVLLEQFAYAINETSPSTRVIALLIDERPEEVTHFKRNVKAEVFSSTSDKSANQHVFLSNITLAHVKTELECGQDIVVLVDSLTRMGRAFNAAGHGSRMTMSGGVSAGALEIPRRFFGLARNIENGGSVTIIATVLIDTGSRMDQLIFEEFKGTGNCEIILDRDLADKRIFPAINILKSGTRKDEKLHNYGKYKELTKIRRQIAEMDTQHAMMTLLNKMQKNN